MGLTFEQNARIVTMDIGRVTKQTQLLVLAARVFFLLLCLFYLLA